MFNKENVISEYSNSNLDGRLYPDTFVVVKSKTSIDVWDTTGWTGFEECDPFIVATFPTTGNCYPALATQAAETAAWSLSIWSDPIEVFNASIDLVNKEKGSFAALKKAVNWRDK